MLKRGLMVLWLVATAGCAAREDGAGRPVVYVSIPPQAGIVRAIAGDRFEVHTLLGPNASHESYEPRPSQLQDLARADVYIRAGVPFENSSWTRLREVNPRMVVVEPFEGVPRRALAEGEGHAHGGEDPHLWLVPANMKRMAAAAADALAKADPGHADEYRANLARVEADLDALDTDLRRELEPVRGKSFWVYHPAWGYFADAYGLRQHAVEQEGRELGSQSLARLIADARQEGVRVIFVDPRTSAKSARLVAQEIGARVETLDPLAEDYGAGLRAAARAIREAVQ